MSSYDPWDERLEDAGRRAEFALRELVEAIDPLVAAERGQGPLGGQIDEHQTKRANALDVCRQVNATMTQLQELAAAAVEAAIRAGASQKATAEALGVSTSTLAGAKREFGGGR